MITYDNHYSIGISLVGIVDYTSIVDYDIMGI